MRLAELIPELVRLAPAAEADAEMEAACAANPDLATFEVIGHSEQGRPLAGVTLGYGPRLVTLVAGAHADEPVGPATLRALVVEALAARDWEAPGGGMADLFASATLRIVPHANPDGEAANRPWIDAWANLAARPAEALASYLRYRRREPPGRDVEFGYPAMRPENEAVDRFLFDEGPVAMHASLHGMGFSEGALVLLESAWMGTPEGRALAEGFLASAEAAGLRPHDHDRGGEKGFRYGGPGVWSTPRGRAMQAHFRALGDDETARRFHLSSMERAVETGAGPRGRTALCVVPELPLFVLRAPHAGAPGVPQTLLEFQQALPDLTEVALDGHPLDDAVERFGIETVDAHAAVGLHLRLLDLALDAIG
jgi:hypothetical protein